MGWPPELDPCKHGRTIGYCETCRIEREVARRVDEELERRSKKKKQKSEKKKDKK